MATRYLDAHTVLDTIVRPVRQLRVVERTELEMRKLEAVARGTPGVKHTVSVSGNSAMIGANAPNFATLYVILDDFPNRRAPGLTADAVAARLQRELSDEVPGAHLTVFGAPAVDGLGNAGGFKMVVLTAMP